MNFLKGLITLSSKKKLVKSTQNYDLFSLTENNVNLSVFKYKVLQNGVNAINILKTLKHPNIINIVKTDKNNSCFTTEELFCIQEFYKESLTFNYYFMCVLSDVLLFLKRCNVSHNNLGFSCLFYTADCKVIIGNFENAGKNKSEGSDDYMFNKMIEILRKDFENKNRFGGNKKEKMGKIHRIKYKKEVQDYQDKYQYTCNNNDCTYIDMFNESYDGFEDFYESNKFLYEESVYKKFENFVMKFKVLTIEEKLNFLDLLMNNKDNWIELNKIKAIDLYLDDLGTDNECYKDKILYIILFLELKNYDKHMDILFCIPDSQVRTFLTANLNHYIKKITNWDDKIFNSVCLGIKCSDAQLKHDSIVFFNRIIKKLSDKNIKSLLKIIYTNVKDNKSVEEALLLIKTNFDRIGTVAMLQDEVYRMLIAFLSYSETRNLTLSTLSKFYKLFDLKKLQLEVIPLLCTLLGDKNNQNLCFDLIERILEHLKENKAKLCAEDWSVKKLEKVISKISFKMPSFKKGASRKDKQNEVNKQNELDKQNEINKQNELDKQNDRKNDWDNEW
ncbi:hypothetical protein BDAP_001245 [Binucleata daphniae]